MSRMPIDQATLPNRLLTIPLLALALSAGTTTAAEVPMSEGLQSVNGTELWVKRMGSGEPIVVVHGGPVLEHGYLLPHIAPLAEDYELILFDQRLSGRSAPEVPESAVRMSDFVEDIEALRLQLGLDKFHLMGHSWGGQLAMRYAIEHEQNLSSLILLDSMAASATLWKEEEKILKESVSEELQARRQELVESPELKARQPEAIEELMQVSFASQFHDPAKVEGFRIFVPADYGPRSRQFAALAPELESYDLHGSLEGLSVPALVLYGGSEPGAELGGKAIAEALPNSELVLIPGAGHFPFIEQPEAFLEAVRAFLGPDSSPEASAELFESRWRLTHLDGEPVPATEAQPSLQFDPEEGEVSGSGGCNRLFGPYEIEGESVRLGPIASTRMSCPGDSLERTFFAALEKAETWRLGEGELELLAGSGELLARFEAAEID